MAEKIYFSSFKGGSGVTTVCVGLGLALAEAGEKTLLVDGDILSAQAMIIAGLGNMQVYTLADYERSACRAKQACCSHPKSPNFYIMPSLGMKDAASAKRAIADVEGLFDYVLLDKIAPSCANSAVIVTEPYMPSVKSSDCCRAALSDGGFENISLIVNKVNGGLALVGEIYTPAQTAEILNLKLLATLPEDVTISVGRWQKNTINAYKTAALAVMGKSGEQFDFMRGYTGVSGIIKRKMRAKI